MKKKTKIFLGIAAVVLVTAVLYFTVLHPRVEVGFQVIRIYDDWGFVDIGDPCQPFTAYNVTDDDLVQRTVPRII